MKGTRVLVVEDDAAIRRGIGDALQFEGYAVQVCERGDLGLQSALQVDCDLLLLDLVLPGVGGLEILRNVRATRPTLPVIILTARGDESDRVAGLRLGADDYVVKPFSVRELLARVAAVLRRSPGRHSPRRTIQLPNGQADLARSEVAFACGERVELSEREAELLQYLAAHPGRVVSRDEILAYVWRISPQGISTRTIDMHVARLREKLRDDPTEPRVIVTVRGKGYMLASEACPS